MVLSFGHICSIDINYQGHTIRQRLSPFLCVNRITTFIQHVFLPYLIFQDTLFDIRAETIITFSRERGAPSLAGMLKYLGDTYFDLTVSRTCDSSHVAITAFN